MTRDELIDKVLSGLRSQSDYSMTKGRARCMYRGSNGTKCAVGQIIPDDEYHEGIERQVVGSMVINKLLRKLGYDEHLPVLAVMQTAHDEAAHNRVPYEEFLKTFPETVRRRMLAFEGPAS